MVTELVAFFVLGSFIQTKFLERVWNKIELLKNIRGFMFEFPEWLNFYQRLRNDVQILMIKWGDLCSQEADVKSELEILELNPRMKRRREVDSWLRNVKRKKIDVQNIEEEEEEENIGAMKLVMRMWRGSRVKRNIQEVDELLQQGRFPEGLVRQSSRAKGEKLLTTPLVGTQESSLDRIWEYVMNDEALIIGIIGQEGIGKTTIVLHINNRIIDSHNNFDLVCWLSVSPEYSILELQTDIARVIRLDFSEETDERKRAAVLHSALRKRGKSLLILDGLSRQFDVARVGIPAEANGCKLSLTTRSSEVCRRMNCGEMIIEVGPLPLVEAENLFKEKLGLNGNGVVAIAVVEIARLIVRECQGLPLCIVNTAERLRGVDGIVEWRNTLSELREVNGRHYGVVL